MALYIGIVHKEQGTSYGVHFPDFPGCISGGDTLEEAVQDASAGLGFHIRSMMKDGASMPEPMALEKAMADEDSQGGIAVLIKPNMIPKGKAIRLNITLDENLLEQIDKRAANIGKSRSAFLADAAREAIQV
jgi:predicted RNase H-like HicB family nuclease